MIQFAATVSKAWMATAIGVAFDHDYYFDPLRRHAVDQQCQRHLDATTKDLDLLFTESNLGRKAFWDPMQALIGGIQPNMILGMLCGAHLLPDANRDADITPTPLAGCGPTDLPPPASLLEHELIATLDAQYREIADAGQWDPIPPFFWDNSGRAAIHGAVTSALKLFGESFLMDLVAAPKRAAAILEWTTDASIMLVRHYADLSDRTIDQVHVGECSGCMVSQEVFSQEVVPTLSRIGRELAPVRWHSCGASNHLLVAAAEVQQLHELDLGGGTTMQQVRRTFGPAIPICVAPLIDDLLAAQPDSLLAWVDRVVRENEGGPLTINCHLEPGFRLDHIRRLRDRTGAVTLPSP